MSCVGAAAREKAHWSGRKDTSSVFWRKLVEATGRPQVTRRRNRRILVLSVLFKIARKSRLRRRLTKAATSGLNNKSRSLGRQSSEGSYFLALVGGVWVHSEIAPERVLVVLL